MKRVGRPTKAQQALNAAERAQKAAKDAHKAKQPQRLIQRLTDGTKRVRITLKTSPASNPVLALLDRDKAAFMMWLSASMKEPANPATLALHMAQLDHHQAIDRSIRLERALWLLLADGVGEKAAKEIIRRFTAESGRKGGKVR